MIFSERLQRASNAVNSSLMVGLDPDYSKLPAHLKSLPIDEALITFCNTIIDETKSFCNGYKINTAFFEAHGPAGVKALEIVADHIPNDRIFVADVKRGDIGNTAIQYAKSVFETLNADACTVSPYMGRDSILPFLDYAEKCTIVLVATSNAGGNDFQYLNFEGRNLYEHVAEKAVGWGEAAKGEVGFVVGATRPEILASLRQKYPQIPFLIPGVGAQGGDPQETLSVAGSGPVMINSSRAIIYASAGEDFAEAAGRAAKKMSEIL